MRVAERWSCRELLEGFAGSYANSDGWTEVHAAVDGLVLRFDDDEVAARAIGERTFEVTDGRRRRRAPTSRSRASDGSATGSPSACREPAVAAGHRPRPAGAEILQEGGTAADAAVAACLASCVAETVMTGLLGGGYATYLEAATGTVRNLDCFVAVPRVPGAPMESSAGLVWRGAVDYAVGASSCAVPGLPAGLDALWRAQGRLPWARLVEPALALARRGVAMPTAHAACLAMLEPVMTMREGAAMYAPGGRLLPQRATSCCSRNSNRARARP